jgi:HD-GYP domain-containing protein (c-di-GMP phosphodiesterase class II)
VADVYDAMASDRAYRKRMEERLILEVISDGSGSQFDPDIVAAFEAAYKKGKISRYMETGQLETIDRFLPING